MVAHHGVSGFGRVLSPTFRPQELQSEMDSQQSSLDYVNSSGQELVAAGDGPLSAQLDELNQRWAAAGALLGDRLAKLEQGE